MSSADRATAAYVEAWTRLVEAVSGGWVNSGGGAVAAVTGLAVPPLNVVFALDRQAEAGRVAELLDPITGAGLPHCLQLRSGARNELMALARARAMRRIEDLPLMVVERAADVVRVAPPSGLVLRQLRPDEVSLHARVAAEGFEARTETFLQLMTPSVLSIPGLRCYVGEIDGDAVTTGFGITGGEAVGVFNIATVPRARGRGFGAAVTARIVADALAAGAGWAVLQSSAAGYPVYHRLGFRTVDRWECWLRP